MPDNQIMISVITGKNSYLLNSKLKTLVDDFAVEYSDIAIEKIDCEEAEYQQIHDALHNLPFLSHKKLVVLNMPGTHSEFAENLPSLIESISDSIDLIIVEPRPDKRSSYFKLLKQQNNFYLFEDINALDLSSWLCAETSRRGGELSASNAKYLVERLGSDQQMLNNELDKLISYDPRITNKTIDLLTEQSSQSTIFELIDSAFAGNIKRAFTLYHEQRSLKVDPIQIIAMLAWQLHVLAIVCSAGSRSSSEISKESGVNQYVVQKSQNIARKLTFEHLRKLINDLQDLDVRSKSQAIDIDEALKNYILTMRD
jgi:DNA polymerase III subunit delta